MSTSSGPRYNHRLYSFDYLDLSFLVTTVFFFFLNDVTGEHRNVWNVFKTSENFVGRQSRCCLLIVTSQISSWDTPGSHHLALGMETLAIGSCFQGFSILCLTPVLLPFLPTISQSKAHLASFCPKPQPAHLHAARTCRHAGISLERNGGPLSSNRPPRN